MGRFVERCVIVALIVIAAGGIVGLAAQEPQEQSCVVVSDLYPR